MSRVSSGNSGLVISTDLFWWETDVSTRFLLKHHPRLCAKASLGCLCSDNGFRHALLRRPASLGLWNSTLAAWDLSWLQKRTAQNTNKPIMFLICDCFLWFVSLLLFTCLLVFWLCSSFVCLICLLHWWGGARFVFFEPPPSSPPPVSPTQLFLLAFFSDVSFLLLFICLKVAVLLCFNWCILTINCILIVCSVCAFWTHN